MSTTAPQAPPARSERAERTRQRILDAAGCTGEQAAYIGDDLPDLPAMARVAFCVAVADAAAEVRDAADLVTQARGGCGAVRETVELILKAQGRWETIMDRYRPDTDRRRPAD